MRIIASLLHPVDTEFATELIQLRLDCGNLLFGVRAVQYESGMLCVEAAFGKIRKALYMGPGLNRI